MADAESEQPVDKCDAKTDADVLVSMSDEEASVPQDEEHFAEMTAAMESATVVDTVGEVVAAEAATVVAAAKTKGFAVPTTSGQMSKLTPAAKPFAPQATTISGASGEQVEDIIVVACEAGDLVLLQRLSHEGKRITSGRPLCIAAAMIENCGVRLVRCLVKSLGADVNRAFDRGATPIFIAAHRGTLALVRCLGKELGADVNLQNDRGSTPLFMAALMNRFDIVRCLVVELGADVNLAAFDGATPLSIAFKKGHLDMARCFSGLGCLKFAGTHDTSHIQRILNETHREMVGWKANAEQLAMSSTQLKLTLTEQQKQLQAYQQQQQQIMAQVQQQTDQHRQQMQHELQQQKALVCDERQLRKEQQQQQQEQCRRKQQDQQNEEAQQRKQQQQQQQQQQQEELQ
jgi:hypothetical protein